MTKELWSDSDKEFVKFHKYEELSLNSTEKEGYLTDRIIASCSSRLEMCPETKQLALCKLELPNKVLIYNNSVSLQITPCLDSI